LRLTTQQIGISIGLVSITFFFSALILAFGFRIQDQPFLKEFHTPGVLWASTVVLGLSSIALDSSRREIRRALVALYRSRLRATLVLAVLFLLLQGMAAFELLAEGAPLQGNPRASMYYVFMALHAAHLAGGVCWLAYLHVSSGQLFAATETDLRNYRRVFWAASVYWHFMGVLWLVLFFFLQHWSN